MKKVLVIITLLLLSACHSSKRLIPSEPVVVNNSENKHTEYLETVRIDTITVEIVVPAESVTHIIPDSVSHLATEFAESDAWVNPDGTLGHSIKNKPLKKPFDVIIPSKDTHTSSTAEIIKEIPVPYPKPVYIERSLTLWEKLRIKAFWYLLAVCLLGAGWIFRKPLRSIIKSLS